MLGYKLAQNGKIRVLITLKIPDDAITNISRSNVAVKENAQYRTNKVKVLKIEDMYGRIYTTATSAFYYKKTIIYNTGETIISKDYDMDLEKVDTEGIHFFLTRKMAEEYDVYHIENGVRIMYHANGMKQSEAIFNNGTVNGLYKSWYPSGKKHVECMCVNGNNHGLYTRWYESGQKEYEGMFIHGKKEGIHEEWYESGKSKIIA